MVGLVDFNGILTASAQQALALRTDSTYRRLVVSGDGDPAAKALLDGVTPATVLVAPARDEGEAALVLAGLWLLHDWLEPSHTLSQGVETANGSFWHAVLHRREGDFNNARYWYGKCRNHPVMATLATEGQAIVKASNASDDARTITRNGWDTYAMVDFVESVYDAADDHPPVQLARDLQNLEWRILFDYTVRAAAGK
ncbi:MAG TPA: hypothetical protein VGN72_06480 [Tepidisphaeraceae bacterium]|jgi:hypothetical protein|nr:hypothetical protein [Tepidisphaeraceae bacterium]